MISVVIPLYNCKKYIIRAIQSVLSQTILPTEIIVVNDGSTDNGEILVKQMRHPLVHLFNQTNAGVSAARNKGITEAKQNLIAFLDADDEWLPDHLETLLGLVKLYPQCGLFASSYYIKSMSGEKFCPYLDSSFTAVEHGVIDNFYKKAAYCADTIFHMNSFIVRKECIDKIGGFPEGIPSGEDIYTIAKLYSVCDFAYSRRATSVYNLTPSDGKSYRPILLHSAIDDLFHSLKYSAAHRKSIKLYIASWHKRRVVGAILNKKWRIAIYHFFIAAFMAPFYRKLYTATIVAIYCKLKSKSLYEINNSPYK